METLVLTKQQAAELFGGRLIDLARAIGISKQAVDQWPDALNVRQIDNVVGAAIRLGLIKTSRDISSLGEGLVAQ